MNYPLIAKLAASSQIIGVGESTHGTHDFFEFKVKLFIELAKKHSFNTFMLEDSSAACQKLNRYIETGAGDLDKLMSSLYSVWRVDELKKLVQWLRDNHANYPIQFLGFDINQNAKNIERRDESMAKNIYDYAKENPKSKFFVWAHNAHIKYNGHTKDEKPMGMFLRCWFGRDYFAVGQFFGYGSFSATIIDEENSDWANRKLSPIEVKSIPDNFLEQKLHEIDNKPFYLSGIEMTAFNYLNRVYPARSLGWGLVPKQLDSIVEKVNATKDFGIITYFPKATHSQPLRQ